MAEGNIDCPKCGAPLFRTDRVCQNCGLSVYCATCGALVEADGHCAACAARAAEEAAKAAEAARAAEAAAAEAAAAEAAAAALFCDTCGAPLAESGRCLQCERRQRAAKSAAAAPPREKPAARAEAPPAEPTDCPKCGALGTPGQACPNCGAAMPELSVAERVEVGSVPRSDLQTADFRHRSEILVFTLSVVGLVALYAVALALFALMTCGFGLILEIPVVILIIIAHLLTLWGMKTAITAMPEVNEHSYPDAFAMTLRAANRLNVDLPPVHLDTDEEEPNAFAVAPFTSMVLLTNGLMKTMNARQLLFVIGHELGHLKCWHVPALMFLRNDLMANQISSYGGCMLWLPLKIGELIMHWWDRLAEYSADRAGLIASGSLVDSIRALYAIHHGREEAEQVDLEAVVREASTAQPDLVGSLAAMADTHPTLHRRVMGLIEFHSSEEYRIARARVEAAQAPPAEA